MTRARPSGSDPYRDQPCRDGHHGGDQRDVPPGGSAACAGHAAILRSQKVRADWKSGSGRPARRLPRAGRRLSPHNDDRWPQRSCIIRAVECIARRPAQSGGMAWEALRQQIGGGERLIGSDDSIVEPLIGFGRSRRSGSPRRGQAKKTRRAGRTVRTRLAETSRERPSSTASSGGPSVPISSIPAAALILATSNNAAARGPSAMANRRSARPRALDGREIGVGRRAVIALVGCRSGVVPGGGAGGDAGNGERLGYPSLAYQPPCRQGAQRGRPGRPAWPSRGRSAAARSRAAAGRRSTNALSSSSVSTRRRCRRRRPNRCAPRKQHLSRSGIHPDSAG